MQNKKLYFKKFVNGKKGFFFTVVAVYLVALLIFSASFYKRYELRKEAMAVNTRIRAMNDFINDVDKDLERGLYISGFRTFLGLEEYISSRGVYLNDTESAFVTAFFNKSIGNYSISLLADSAFSDWASRINSHAADINIQINFTISNLTISQSSPWAVDLSVNVSMHVYDVNGLASWDRDKTISTSINIIDFEDPVYTVNSYGRIANPIVRATDLNFVTGYDTTVLLRHLNNSYYVASPIAPSFLMRLEGNLSPSPAGIESLVDVSKFIAEGFSDRQKSVVDYIYFSSRSTSNLCVDNSKAEPNMPSWFRLDIDDNHASYYEILGLNATCS